MHSTAVSKSAAGRQAVRRSNRQQASFKFQPEIGRSFCSLSRPITGASARCDNDCYEGTALWLLSEVFSTFQVSALQTVCDEAVCQRQRRTDYHRQKIAADPEYRDVCLDSPRKWRSRNPGYWKQYRQKNPAAVERNRQNQQLRDRKRKLCNLANNTSALDLKHSAAQVWLVGTGAADLANNNSAPAQIWVIEVFPPRRASLPPSCKQQPAGVAVDPAA